ncbi:MAG: hypothetical protein D6B26_02600 [Spirochaetaceae bacterium]|nr:MAG: hypothetical protein D6B26_02600 [Spirochaetaceae bacterium]
MNNKKITLRVLLATFISIYLAIIGYTILLPQIFVMGPAEAAAFWKKMLIVVTLVGALATWIVYMFYRPVAQALLILDQGKELDKKSFLKAQKAFKSVEGFLFAIGLAAYNLGAVANMVPELIGGGPIDRTYWIFRFVLAGSFGFVNGIMTARMVNLAWIQAKYRMGIVRFEESHKKTSTLVKLGVPITLVMVMLLVFFTSAVLYYSIMIDRGKVSFSVAGAIRHFVPFAIFLGIEAVMIIFAMLQESQSHIKHLQNQVNRLASGEMDLASRIFIISYDDMGYMSSGMNQILENLKNSIIAVRMQAAALDSAGKELSQNMNQTATAVGQIIANIEGVQQQTMNQTSAVEETNTAVDQISQLISRLNSRIEQQAVTVSQSSSAIEQMLASIQSVTETLINNSGNIDRLTKASESGRVDLSSVASDIQLVVKDSESLLEISTVIQEIASQTNLLSMNAAIEAAHAGEAGKGFAVVAEEIRKLAETSGQEAQKVAGVLTKIKTAVDKITQSTAQVSNRFEEIDSEIKIVAAQESMIRNAMEEQSAGSREVFEGISQLNDITQQVKEGSGQMLQASRQVIQEGRRLKTITTEIAESMAQMAEGAGQIQSTVEAVDTLGMQNSQSIAELLHELEQFHTET